MKWETPTNLPPVGMGTVDPKVKWLHEVSALKQKPGEWALITEKTGHRAACIMAYEIRMGRLVAFRPAGEFESWSAGTKVYARYIGDKDGGAA